MSTHDERHQDPELAPIAGRLDTLGDRDRAAAPADFEDRLLRVTLPALRSERETDAPPVPPPVIARIGFHRSPAFRLAASVALGVVATVAGLWIVRAGQRPATPPAFVEGDRTTEQILDDIDAEFAAWVTDLADLDRADADDSSTDPADFWNLGGDIDLLMEET